MDRQRLCRRIPERQGRISGVARGTDRKKRWRGAKRLSDEAGGDGSSGQLKRKRKRMVDAAPMAGLGSVEKKTEEAQTLKEKNRDDVLPFRR